MYGVFLLPTSLNGFCHVPLFYTSVFPTRLFVCLVKSLCAVLTLFSLYGEMQTDVAV